MTQHNRHISNSYFCPALKWATLSALCFLKDKGQGKLANDASVRSTLFKPQLGMVLDNFSITLWPPRGGNHGMIKSLK